MQFKDNSLSGILRSLIADEFLAWTSYYFYELISQGKALNFTNKIFNKNGKDELEDHFHKLVTWTQSKEIPIPTGLLEMQDICNTQYAAYKDQTDTSTLVNIMINAEKEAIDAYVQAMKEPAIIEYPDLVQMLGEICIDEREHLKELMDVKSNLDKYNKSTIDEEEAKMQRDDVFYSNFTERISKAFSNFASIEEAAAEKYPDLAGNGGKKVFLDKIDTWGSITAYLAGDSTENVIIANSKDKSMHKHKIPDDIGDGPELNEWAKSIAKKDYPDQMSAQSMQDKTLNENKHKQSTLPNLARNQYQSAYEF